MNFYILDILDENLQRILYNSELIFNKINIPILKKMKYLTLMTYNFKDILILFKHILFPFQNLNSSFYF
jgi:hypothetical protein